MLNTANINTNLDICWNKTTTEYYNIIQNLIFKIDSFFSTFSLDSKKIKEHSTFTLDDRNNFIESLVTVKSSDLRSCVATEKHYSPYNKTGIQFLINWRVTSSDAILPMFPKMALVEWLTDCFAWVTEHFICRPATTCLPKYRISSIPKG